MSKRDFFKQKVLLIFGYNGANYHGLQAQKNTTLETVESRLYQSLFDSNLIAKANFGELQKSGWSRGARTDKGVHALCNAIAVKLCITQDYLKKQTDELDKLRDKQLIDNNKVIASINSNLPQDIKVHGIKLTTQGFDVRKSARSRIYEYTIPISVYKTEEFTNDQIFERVKQVIKVFEGTHNFHNYSRAMKFTDPSSNRYILDINVERFTYKDCEFLKFTLHGQSFVYHQIRKMMGVVIQLFQEGLPDSFIGNTFFKNELRILLAPPEGLFLNRITFDSYNKKIDIPQQLIIEDDEQLRIDQFRPLILNHICEQEIENKVFSNWIQTLKEKNFQQEAEVDEAGDGDC